MYTHSHQKHSSSCVWLHNSWMTNRCGHQNAVKRWQPPKWRSPYGGCYKYTSCLSGTAKCFYAMTRAYVRAPFMAVGRGWWWWWGGYIRSHSTLCMSWICIRQRRACSAATRPLCPLCFRRVGHFLMPSDRHRGSHCRQVSSRVAHNGERACYYVKGHEGSPWHGSDLRFCFFYFITWLPLFALEKKQAWNLLNHEKAQKKAQNFDCFSFPKMGQNLLSDTIIHFGCAIFRSSSACPQLTGGLSVRSNYLIVYMRFCVFLCFVF